VSIPRLTSLQAQERLVWLAGISGLELVKAGGLDDVKGEGDIAELAPAAIEKLHEIARVARQVAKHYETQEANDDRALDPLL
jgi:hypothetical protein